MTATASPRPLVLVALGVGALVGAGGTYLALSQRSASAPPPAATVIAPASPVNATDGSVRLSPDDVARAHILTTPVEAMALGESVTIPGLVEANAYRQTAVTALIPGRIARVLAELGQRVRRGQALAELYSPELADAQRAYISASAALRAHEQQLARTDALVAIGSMSRQDLEMAHAEHAALTTNLEQTRTRLELLGLPAERVAALESASQITAAMEIRAPLDGVVTTREASVGANVEGTTALFTVTDLSTVWIVGDLNERDFPKVAVGRAATVTVSAFPDLALHGTISYIDPQLSRETRTARVRVDVPNRQDQLRLGMYAQLRIDTVGDHVGPAIPKTAIQRVGDHTVVYVADPTTPGLFLERTIRTGVEAGDKIGVRSGVAIGESVVTAGSFSLRAERERLGQSADAPPTSAAADQAVGQGGQTARITVTDKGFEPALLTLKAGVPARVTFIRTTDATCAKGVVFPSLNIRRELPLNTPVEIAFTPSRGDLGFVCGIGMFKGTVSAQ
ncbi:MAG: efflux RND transporter periplasmic adaptor subunit [Vicinamibacterales bacterium]